MPRLMPSNTPKVNVIIKPGIAYSSHILCFCTTLEQVFIQRLWMASKLDTLTEQLLQVKASLTDGQEHTKRVVAIVEEIVQYITTIQEECIKLLQERTVDERTVPQPPFRWDTLRNDTSPFKAPFGHFSD